MPNGLSKTHHSTTIPLKLIGTLLLSTLLISACSEQRAPVPVRNISTDINATEGDRPAEYRVRSGDTLYAIAFRFGMDFEKLASLNGISAPYLIHTGQTLRLKGAVQQSTAPLTSKPKTTTKTAKKPVVVKKSPYDDKKKVTGWLYPVKKNILRNFSSGKDGLKGIMFGGKVGDPVKASASGRVVYAGSGLVGYGNLIIIKHSKDLLSAYAHNEKILVKEQQVIQAGDKIATMGKDDTGRTQLHFEIRYQGRPVNPLKYLP